MTTVFGTIKRLFGIAALMLSTGLTACLADGKSEAVQLPPPALDRSPPVHGLQVATFAGGCFWGVQGTFQHVKGVKNAVSGYSGGTLKNPSYEDVSSGDTGHAESVQVTFDPAQISYGKLLQIFFSVVTDPTQINRQGPDTGTQYRTEIFVADDNQKTIAQSYINQLSKSHNFSKPIATKIDQAGTFYKAEPYHQDFLNEHPNNPYILAYDRIKVDDLRRLFPNQWQANPTLVAENH